MIFLQFQKQYFSYMILLVFLIFVTLGNKFYLMFIWCLCCYFFFQLHIISLYNFFFYVSNILIFGYMLSFMSHCLCCFDKVFTMLLPCFKGFKTCLIKFLFHIIGICSRWFFESIQQSCWCNQVAKLHPMFLDVWR